MGAAIRLRCDYTGDHLRRLARASRDAAQTRRLLALAAIYDAGSRPRPCENLPMNADMFAGERFFVGFGRKSIASAPWVF